MIKIDLSWMDIEKLEEYMKKTIEDFLSLQRWLILKAKEHKIDPVTFSFVVNTITLEIAHHIMHSTIISENEALEACLKKLLMEGGENNKKEVNK